MKAHRAVLLLTLCLAASNLRAQDPKGSELRINPRTTGQQWLPAVAAAADGSFVVVWQVGGGTLDFTEPVFILARLFDATGRPRSGEIQVGRRTAANLGRSAVAMAPDGRFVVVWGSGPESSSIAFGRRFAADGSALGPRFRLDRSTERSQLSPDVAMAPDGSFVAAWTQWVEGDEPWSSDIFFRRFGPNGRPLGPAAVAISFGEEQTEPRVAMRPQGDFVIVSEYYGGESSFYDVMARRFSRSGTPIGDEFLVTDGPTWYVTQEGPDVAMAADGRFAIVWTDWAADSTRDPSLILEDSYGIGARFYGADGTPLGPEIFVNAFLPGIQTAAAITVLQNGGFLVLWASGAGQDGDGYGIFGRVYGADGTPRGREFRMNLNRTGSQSAPAVAVAPNGKGVAAWNGPDGDRNGVFARLIGIPRRGS